MKRTFYLVPALLILISCSSEDPGKYFSDAITVPVKGNSWIDNQPELNDKLITNEGTKNWTQQGLEIKTWIRCEGTGSAEVALIAAADSGSSVIEAGYGENTKKIRLKNSVTDTIAAGKVIFSTPGYNYFYIKGISYEGRSFGNVKAILIKPDSSLGKIKFVKDDFYWGRRGPSVHLRFTVPEEARNIEWFYNEITVPEGNDVIGSYFMANGFTDGYFGIQVNSENERRILFSVWSSYKTDDPKQIPEEFRIKMLRKGEGVHTGEFGNEGSGGQSYLKYLWKAGVTYSFLLHGVPAPGNSTDYTAWFLDPEKGDWMLIASFRKPSGSRYLGNLYSFLENFHTGTGNVTRMAEWSNQWICDKNGKWTELTSARFSADATARKESRLDYAGGENNGRFFLKNCGFFSETTNIGSVFTREAKGEIPVKDLLKFK